METASRGRLAAALGVALAVLPLVPPFVSILRSPWATSATDDDLAILEIGVMEAARGAQLLGPYSRFGWSHPGPSSFYALVPAYLAGGRRTAALNVGALVLNGAAAAALVAVAFRLGGARLGILSLPLVAVLLSFLGPSVVSSFWNPHVTVVPFALYLLLAAGLSARGASFLPGLVLVGTFLVQTHLGYFPAVAACGAVAALSRLRRGPREMRPAPSVRRPALLSAGLVALLWAPSVVEEIRSAPGNLTLIGRFFLSGGATHPFGEVFLAVARPLAAVPLHAVTLLIPSTSDERAVGAGLLTLLLVALLPLARSTAVRRVDAACIALSETALVAVAVAFLAALKIRGPVHDYLLLWVTAAGFLGWMVLAHAAVSAWRESGRGVALRRGTGVAAALVLVGLATARTAREARQVPLVRREPMSGVRTLSDAVARRLHEAPGERALVVLGSHDVWAPLGGVLRDLRREGLAVSVEKDWLDMYGRSFAPTGAETRTLVFALGPETAALRERPGHRLLAEAEGTSIFEGPPPGTWRAEK